MPSRNQPTEHDTPTSDSIPIPQAPYHMGTNYLPWTNDRLDPTWFPYVEANREDINILKHHSRNDKQALNQINQKVGHLNQDFDFLNQRYELQQQQLKRRDVAVEHINATLSSLSNMQEITQAHITASNSGIERANERLTTVEGWFQSLWYKIERMDENDDAYRAVMRNFIDEIEGQSRLDRENLEKRMELMEEKIDVHREGLQNHHKACEAKCDHSAYDQGMRELVAKTDDMVLTSMCEKQHYNLRLDQMERLLADQKSESLTLRQEMRHMQEEKEKLLAEQKGENEMLKQQMKRMLEEFEEFKAQCMHSPESSMPVSSGKVSETNWPSNAGEEA